MDESKSQLRPLSVVRYLLSVICCPLSVIRYLLSVICYTVVRFRLSFFGIPLSIFCLQISSIGHPISVIDCHAFNTNTKNNQFIPITPLQSAIEKIQGFGLRNVNIIPYQPGKGAPTAILQS
jgi:hypothetical protein